MKKAMLNKLMCAVLTAVCVVTTAVPTLADDSVVTAEAATKSVTSAYKYHLNGYNKKGYTVHYSKKSFYKDLNSLPTIKTGKTTITVPAASNGAKSVSAQKSRPRYQSFVKFKVPKTGKYVFTLTNLRGTDDKSVKEMFYYDVWKTSKENGKYYLEAVDHDTVGDYDTLYENNYLEKLQSVLNLYKEEYPEYDYILDADYNDFESYVSWKSTNKIKFTAKLKKGQTYVYLIDNVGSRTCCQPYQKNFGSSEQRCLYNTDYMEAYSFDMNIECRK